jgi:hypothetical protein
MPIPFIFPIAGFVMTGAGMVMIVRYIQADEVRRGKLDTWLTDALKATVKTYVRVRYGINIGSLTAAEEKEYWCEFGLRASPSRDQQARSRYSPASIVCR